ncbi:hypothetical protein HZH68_003314 [Vespula germanica]|uniref:Uncharacterized protein n=2 Tax=Vespula TaxID=7451 RepID=A0A834U2R3_VESGE|nr:hypothetical protein HZH68_003314 [Vespula germanica]KAF7435467.1 hypothetical protein H0235_003658 [Vespula pensylvanica]
MSEIAAIRSNSGSVDEEIGSLPYPAFQSNDFGSSPEGSRRYGGGVEVMPMLGYQLGPFKVTRNSQFQAVKGSAERHSRKKTASEGPKRVRRMKLRGGSLLVRIRELKE